MWETLSLNAFNSKITIIDETHIFERLYWSAIFTQLQFNLYPHAKLWSKVRKCEECCFTLTITLTSYKLNCFMNQVISRRLLSLKRTNKHDSNLWVFSRHLPRLLVSIWVSFIQKYLIKRQTIKSDPKSKYLNSCETEFLF